MDVTKIDESAVRPATRGPVPDDGVGTRRAPDSARHTGATKPAAAHPPAPVDGPHEPIPDYEAVRARLAEFVLDLPEPHERLIAAYVLASPEGVWLPRSGGHGDEVRPTER